MYTAYPDIRLANGIVRSTDIPQFPASTYEVAVRVRSIEEHVCSHVDDFGLDLDPRFQRAHVWTQEQQIAYVEYLLQGGEVAKTLIFSCRKWRECAPEDYVLVDGKQRLNAIRGFMRGEVPAFGKYRPEIEMVGLGPMIYWRVVEVNTQEDAMRLYLSLNCGGTPHTAAELDKVRELLKEQND